MKLLFLGGTGNISAECVARALALDYEVTVLTRGTRPQELPGVAYVTGDRHDRALLQEVAAGQRFDAVINFLGFAPSDVALDAQVFAGRVGQYLFISSASVYEKPPSHYVITEATCLANPLWQYARDKIACEEVLLSAYRSQGFPVTIVRPSYTYGETWIPCGIGGHGYTVVDRLRRGKPVISHGDGQSLWVMTHASDFAVGLVGLLGKAEAIGEALHITGDEVLTWDAIYRTMAQEAGCEAHLVHIPCDLIAACYPQWGPGLLGDKAYSQVFDNSKVRRLVPAYRPAVTFAEGIRRSLAWHDADPATRHIVNADTDRMMDDLVARQQAACR
jgi:nucleoside-diphosphate-sugar epimerase